MKTLAMFGVVSLFLAAQANAADYEEPEFSVVASRDGYEVREYGAFVVADVVVTGPYGKALNDGFLLLAGYIFGGNADSAEIPMATPVFHEDVPSEVPGESRHRITFVMPRDKTLENLPKPLDDRITFRQIPEGCYAVSTFKYWATEAVAAKQKQALLEAMARDGLSPQGPDLVAQYNEPWTRGDLRRNEVLVPVSREEVEKIAAKAGDGA